MQAAGGKGPAPIEHHAIVCWCGGRAWGQDTRDARFRIGAPDILLRLFRVERAQPPADVDQRRHPACGATAPRNLGADVEKCANRGLVATKAARHEQFEESRGLQFRNGAVRNTTRLFDIRRTFTQLGEQTSGSRNEVRVRGLPVPVPPRQLHRDGHDAPFRCRSASVSRFSAGRLAATRAGELHLASRRRCHPSRRIVLFHLASPSA